MIIRVDCRSRVVSVGVDHLCSDHTTFLCGQPVYHGDGRPTSPGERFAELPQRLPADVTSLRPWVVSASAGDAFEIVWMRVSARRQWSPASHARFPLAARQWVVELLRLGHLLAAYSLPMQQERRHQGAFIQCWVQLVMPVATDLHFSAAKNPAPEPSALEEAVFVS